MTFKVLLHHYGRFTSPSRREFIGDMVATIEPVELETFLTEQMKLILTNCLGYDENSSTFLYIKKPNCSFDLGLALLGDAILRDMILTYTQSHRNRLHVFNTVLILNDGSLEESFAGIISEETKIQLEESLSYLHQMQKRKNKKFDYYELLGDLDFLTGDRSSNLYTIALNEIVSYSSTCLLAKASSLQSWLWHQRLSHLNFATINNLMKNNLVRGLPKMKFERDHLCSACEQRKIHRKHHKSKTVFASNKPLYLLHMDLCGPITPQQNGVVERRNRTLVKAARTMLTFANLPLFLWAEAIATACFTQNRSIIYKRFDKTPYELINKRKPNIKFFYVFGCRCYLFNNYDDVGKLKPKGDIGVFVGYLKEFAAFRISLEHGLSNLNETRKSSNPTVSPISEISKKDLEDLFYNFYDEYSDSSKITKSSTTNVENSNNEIPSQEGEISHEVFESFQEEFSFSSLNDEVQQSSEEDHPLHKIIGDPKSSVRTRGQLANSYLFSYLLSNIEPANVDKALKVADWVSAMQDELD
nr:retrotransposon-related protein [Tanacetum cinerariifolium]